jgi:hypothetical protein
MSTPTPRLGILKPEGSDPFRRTDFNDTWDLLDDAPGTHICTSGSRPSWGSDQAGRLIVETDTNRILRWTGSAFYQVRQSPNGWSFFNDWSDETVAHNTGVEKSIGNVVTSTPGQMVFICVSNVQCERASVQDVSTGFKVDGTFRHGAEKALTRWAIPGGSLPGSPDNDTRDATVMGTASLSAGSTPLKVTFDVGDGSQHVTIRHTRTVVIMVNTSAGGNPQ